MGVLYSFEDVIVRGGKGKGLKTFNVYINMKCISEKSEWREKSGRGHCNVICIGRFLVRLHILSLDCPSLKIESLPRNLLKMDYNLLNPPIIL